MTEASDGAAPVDASAALRGNGVFEIDSQWDGVTYTRTSMDTLTSERQWGEPSRRDPLLIFDKAP